MGLGDSRVLLRLKNFDRKADVELDASVERDRFD